MTRLVSVFIVLLLMLTSASHATAQSSEIDLSASDALEGLADESRFQRQLSGGLTVAGGGALMLVGFATRPDEDDYTFESDYKAAEDTSNFLVIGGAILTGAGVLQLAIPSAPERSWNRVERIDDAQRRNDRAYSELSQLANNARTGRLLGGGFSLGLSAYYFLATPEDDSLDNYYLYNGLIFGALGASQLLVKSPAERTFDRLESDRQTASSGPDINFGIALNRSGGAGLGMNVRF